jgi:hypothetical protein
MRYETFESEGTLRLGAGCEGLQMIGAQQASATR